MYCYYKIILTLASKPRKILQEWPHAPHALKFTNKKLQSDKQQTQQK